MSGPREGHQYLSGSRRKDTARCSHEDASPQRPSVSARSSRRGLGSGFSVWSGREDLNLDSFPGREACCYYTTSAKPAFDGADTFLVSTTSGTTRAAGFDFRRHNFATYEASCSRRKDAVRFARLSMGTRKAPICCRWRHYVCGVTPPAGSIRRLLATSVVFGLLAMGCSSTSPGGNAGEGANRCSDLLDATIRLVRGSQVGQGRDLLSESMESLRLGGCRRQSDVIADYLSVQGVTKTLGIDSCSELAGYGIRATAIKLLRQDGLCSGRARVRSTATAADRVQPGGGIPWDEAREHVGTWQRVCGPLSGIGSSDDDVFLNIGRDFPDPQRFTIVLWDVGGVEPKPSGTMLCASGQVTSYEGVAQLELRSLGAVQIYN